MATSKVSLSELLRHLADDKEKYHIPLSDSARYAIKVIVDVDDSSYYSALPADVKGEIQEMIDIYKRTGKLQFISNLGSEDFSERMEKFVRLIEK